MKLHMQVVIILLLVVLVGSAFTFTVCMAYLLKLMS